MKRIVALMLLACASLTAAFAGDVATLVNLGFSADSGHYMFGYYGIDSKTGTPYAEVFVVDTKKNEFVPQGSLKGLYAAKLEPGWDAEGAFYTLFADATGLARKFGIDHLAQGRLVYLLLNGDEAPQKLSFRDFKTDAAYEVTLVQKPETKDGKVSSGFGISVAMTGKDGKRVAFNAGNAAIKRKDIASYAIREIILGPDERTFVFLLEKREGEYAGGSMRYMVETVRIP